MGSGVSCCAILMTAWVIGGLGSGMGSGVSSCAMLMAAWVIGGLGSGMGSGVSGCAIKGVALAANMRSARRAKRAVGFNIVGKSP